MVLGRILLILGVTFCVMIFLLGFFTFVDIAFSNLFLSFSSF